MRKDTNECKEVWAQIHKNKVNLDQITTIH